ncbi:NimC/NimA family protein [Clostridia bacterium]|nr:NimC/NimA family protein [Clostridia bacterium]
MTKQEVIDFLRKNKIFYVATVDGDQPRVRPFGAVCEFEGKLYIPSNNKKDVAKQIQANPNIELTTGATEDGQWLRLCAKAHLDDRLEAKQAMLSENPMLKEMYKEDDGIFAVFALTGVQARRYSFASGMQADVVEW